MKILYVCHQFFPEFHTGTERFVFNVASMIAKAGHQVKILSYSFKNIDGCDSKYHNIAVYNEVYNGLPVVKVKRIRNEPAHYELLSSEDLKRFAIHYLYKEKPDVVHFGHTMRLSEFVYAANFLNIPYVLTLTDFFLLCPKVNLTPSPNELCQGPIHGSECAKLCSDVVPEFNRHRLKVVENEILRGAKKLFAPSLFVAKMFEEEFNGLSVEIIGHGVSVFPFYGLPISDSTKIKLTYAGSFNYFKGVHVVIAALALIESDNIELKIYGSGSDAAYNDMIMQMIAKDQRVTYCGVYDENQLGEIFSRSDAIVIPSICYETYSFVLHEAFKFNLPVIASNLGAISEKILHGVNGLLFQAGDPESLAQLFKDILTSPRLLEGISSNIRKEMIPTIEQEASRYERGYIRACTNK